MARAVASGATEIERVDLLIQSIAASKGLHHDMVDAMVKLVDSWLLRSREVHCWPPLEATAELQFLK
jgi:hypothetical protein